jgi:hypothetical protein
MIRIVLSEDDFRALVAGQTVRPLQVGDIVRAQDVEIILSDVGYLVRGQDVEIILSDIGFDRMKQAVLDAKRER